MNNTLSEKLLALIACDCGYESRYADFLKRVDADPYLLWHLARPRHDMECRVHADMADTIQDAANVCKAAEDWEREWSQGQRGPGEVALLKAIRGEG